MRHPRDLYVRACQSVGKFPGFDYFDHEPFTYTQELNTRLKALERFMLNTANLSAPKRIRECFMFYNDIEQRIFLEGLLFNYTTADISQIRGFTIEFLEDYKSYFFDVDNVKDGLFRHLFISSINEDEVRDWFIRCEQLSFANMFYLITGQTKERDALDVVRETRTKLEAAFNAFLPSEVLLNPKAKLSSQQKYLISQAEKFAKLSAKLAIDELRLGNKAKQSNSKNLNNDWRAIIKKNPSSIYDVPLTSNIGNELEEQFNQFPGLKVAETEILSELAKEKDSD